MNQNHLWIILAVGAALPILLGLIGWFIRLGREIQIERARELFRLQRERLGEQFREAASATGKPRGVRWLGCALDETFLLAIDRTNKQIIALASAVLSFEAEPDGEMEGVPAVNLPKHATTIFYFQRGQWMPTDRAVMNLTPTEVLDRFAQEFEPIDGAHHA